MHTDLSVTDGIYGILTDMDVRNQIKSLTKDNNTLQLENDDVSLIVSKFWKSHWKMGV